MSVVEALPFCHHNICFNILCFFPDWNHLNCICRGLYRLINIVTPLRAPVFCDSTAPVKEREPPANSWAFTSLKGLLLPFLQWVGRADCPTRGLCRGTAALLRGCLGSCQHEVTPKSQISLHLPPGLFCLAFSCTG